MLVLFFSAEIHTQVTVVDHQGLVVGFGVCMIVKILLKRYTNIKQLYKTDDEFGSLLSA